jgi:maleylacetate reductase
VLVLCSPEQEVTGKQVAAALGERAAGLLPEARMHVPIEVATRARDLARELGADGCVAVGRRSAVGLGKAIALEHDLPVIAVPTTYAGSEMTPVWGLTEGGAKRTGRDVRVLPRSVVYDAELTLTLHAGLSPPAGINAIAHAVEGLYAPDATPIVSLMAEEGDPGAGRRAARGWSPTARPRRPRRGPVRRLAVRRGAGRDHDVAAPQAVPHPRAARWTCRTPQTHTVVLPHALAYNAPSAPDAVAALSRALGGAPDPARNCGS